MYLGPLIRETQYEFEEIRNAIWYYESHHEVLYLLMPDNVFAQLQRKAQQNNLGAPQWHYYRGGSGMATCDVQIRIDNRVEGIEYVIEERAPANGQPND